MLIATPYVSARKRTMRSVALSGDDAMTVI
jgi:hypothetical protein